MTLTTYFEVLVVAVVCGLILVPLARRAALAAGAISVPGGRHVHKTPTPRWGGIAVCIAFFAALIPARQFIAFGSPETIGLIAGAVLMCAVGAVDDLRRVRALYKLGVQVIAATIAYVAGAQINGLSLPLIGSFSMGIFSYPVTVLWFIGIVNAINLIDGLDGLASGVAMFAGLTNAVISYLHGDVHHAAIMIALVGAIIAFLMFNFNPALIFLGDSGSYFIGFVIAYGSLTGGSKASTSVSLVAPMIALGVPIFDTLLAMFRRVLEKRSIFSADREHLHHKLVERGLTHRRAVLVIYGISLVLMIAGIVVTYGHQWQVGVALVVAFLLLFTLVRWVGYFEYIKSIAQGTRVRSEMVERLRRHLPGCLIALAEVDSEEKIWLLLKRTAHQLALKAIDIVPVGPRDKLVRTSSQVWFVLGAEDSNMRIVFVWPGEIEINQQVDILLQVLVDQLAIKLDALGVFAKEDSKIQSIRPTSPSLVDLVANDAQ